MGQRETKLQLDTPEVTTEYFIRIKFAEGHDTDADEFYNANNISADYAISGSTPEEAMINAYEKYSPEALTSSWVRFEVYEEAVTRTRRLIHIANRSPKLIEKQRKFAEATLLQVAEEQKTAKLKYEERLAEHAEKENTSKSEPVRRRMRSRFTPTVWKRK